MPPRRKRNAKNSAASYDEMYPPSGDPALEAPEAADPGPGSAAADAPPADAPAADSPAAAVADPEAARRELETAHRAQARVFRMDLQKKKKEATAKGKDAAKAWRSEEQRLEKEFLDQQAQEMRLLEERLAAMSALRTAEAAEEPGSSTTRAQRRRDKKSAEEQARYEQGVAEAALLPDLKAAEDALLLPLLSQAGLSLFEIRPDGHCLFNAVDHQYSHVFGQTLRGPNHWRRFACDWMRQHRDHFQHFAMNEDGEVTDFDEYLETMEHTAVWGGHPELFALASATGTPIHVFQAPSKVATFGDLSGSKLLEAAAEAGALVVISPDEGVPRSGKPALSLVYQRHTLGLGEHYNSTLPSAPQ
ncbi:hypothetical protein H696_05158 [Fonticula alba]|uniref:OTU domain-containing protein n=1 Tax=Fonticula alba TaxID=691883 RepID=A0A058Z1S4_FONAL|nr:hypothetical protein H696_05158 [Fonticula alba]KCV68234.1 hypothetical protein H696_05158 [Fonticula alba]|eukprot:XP_009497288.1 hypothetical protein H696_05158 [Fonticula alba]